MMGKLNQNTPRHFIQGLELGLNGEHSISSVSISAITLPVVPVN